MAMSQNNFIHSPRDIDHAIASGYVFDYHVLGKSFELGTGAVGHPIRFGDNPAYGIALNIETRLQFEERIYATLMALETVGYRRSDGGAVFFNQQSNTLVFYNPIQPHLGTATRDDKCVAAFIDVYARDVMLGRANPLP